MNFIRRLQKPSRSFFLFGPRATGKSTWLRSTFPEHYYIDLLRNDVYFDLSSDPKAFRQRILGQKTDTWIIVDEVQRLPDLLNDIHALIEDKKYRFALSGSSARKLKRGQANLLAGRASVKHMFPLTWLEYKDTITLEESLAFGALPSVVTDPSTRIEQLEAYVGVYLREEIKEEALTRNVPGFSRFLETAAILNGQVTNLTNVARDTGISRSTTSTYFEILVDTLLGFWLPAWTPRAKVKEVSHPKFYFFDTGVLRGIQKLLREKITPDQRGILFETWLLNELIAHRDYANTGGEFFYWRTSSGIEINIIWQRAKTIVAIEVKSTSHWKSDYEAGFRSLLSSPIKPSACYGVYLGNDILQRDFGLVLPWQEFLQRLYNHQIIGSEL
jgi:uncharacterized protein